MCLNREKGHFKNHISNCELEKKKPRLHKFPAPNAWSKSQHDGLSVNLYVDQEKFRLSERHFIYIISWLFWHTHCASTDFQAVFLVKSAEAIHTDSVWFPLTSSIIHFCMNISLPQCWNLRNYCRSSWFPNSYAVELWCQRKTGNTNLSAILFLCYSSISSNKITAEISTVNCELLH